MYLIQACLAYLPSLFSLFIRWDNWNLKELKEFVACWVEIAEKVPRIDYGIFYTLNKMVVFQALRFFFFYTKQSFFLIFSYTVFKYTSSFTFKLNTSFYNESLSSRMVTLLRVLRIVILVRIFRLASQKKQLEVVTRRMVSENKRRYMKDGFDLDLTYVTDRVIAMSFPSSGKQSFYRNPIEEVARFLDTKHADHYKVYNLCSEKGYDPKYFHYRVERIFIDDHNVPALQDMLKFTASVHEWMNQDEKNIIAIHCKGGKGRTGTMVCTWLIHSDQFESAKESLDYFGERRTDRTTSTKFQGVETPSQSRYVGYYEILKNKYNFKLPPERQLKIKNLKIHSIHGVGKGNGTDMKVQVIMRKQVVLECVCATQGNCKVRV
uniref:Phosphatidylinositol-3,4,5-trisphosphate 3-phosphatase n=1 Tax=Pavo cristatus TaxID=9049 RepID=A0A8C9EU60_PAVCR